MGFETNNDMFKAPAKYFRNALVRANYQNLEKNIPYTMEYLNNFFGNLLLGEHHVLSNEIMQIKDFSTAQKTTQKNTSSTAQKILQILSENPKSSRKELALETGLSEDGIKWNLDKLKKESKIRRIGPDKGGYWEVV